MDFVATGSGLLAPPSALAAQEGPKVVQKTLHGHDAPSVPDGFLRDLKAYGKQWGREYRPFWIRARGLWSIQMLQSNGQWAAAILVWDREKATDQERWPYAPLDRRVFEELYAADLWSKWSSGNPDTDFETDTTMRRHAMEVAADELSRLTDKYLEDNLDIEYGMKLLRAAATQGLTIRNGRAHLDGFRVSHQVPRATPAGQ